MYLKHPGEQGSQTCANGEKWRLMMLNKMIFTILTTVLLTFTGVTSSMAGQGPGNGEGQATLTAAEIEDMLLIREEEKLARDSYITLGGIWGLMIFENIALSEQIHMDAVERLLDKYGLPDPVVDESDVGSFLNQDLQKWFDELMLRGKTPLMDALYVGAEIEEYDIRDITNAIDNTTQPDITGTYTMLLCGARNHLRAFVRQIENLGVVYEPVIFTPEEIALIVDSPMQRRCGNSGSGEAKRHGHNDADHHGKNNEAGDGIGKGPKRGR
jgi:hypothetical protein